VSVRICVEGMRGKSGLVCKLERVFRNRGLRTLAKATGKEPFILFNGEKIPIKRKEGKYFFIEEENKRIIEEYGKNVDVMIFENQAISKYTMKVFHKVFEPDIIIIPNVRLEHQEGMGDTIEEIAESFATRFNDARFIINAELNESVKRIFKEYAKKYKCVLINIKHNLSIMSEQIPIINEVLKLFQLEQLSNDEVKEIQEEIEESKRVKYSEKVGVWYLDASKVNDVDSAKLFFENLLEQTNKPIIIVSYFRADRIDRTYAFKSVLREWSGNERVIKMYFGGFYYDVIFDECKKNKSVERVSIKDIRKIIEFAREKNAVLFLSVNGVNKFMIELRKLIE